MKTLTAIFLVFAFSSFAQQNDDWITPFANIEINEGNIYYSYTEGAMMHVRLSPLFITENLIVIVDAMRYPEFDSLQYWQQKIMEVASGNGFTGSKHEDRVFFLRTFALQCIWSMGNRESLPAGAGYDFVTLWCKDEDKSLAAMASAVKDFYDEIASVLK